MKFAGVSCSKCVSLVRKGNSLKTAVSCLYFRHFSSLLPDAASLGYQYGLMVSVYLNTNEIIWFAVYCLWKMGSISSFSSLVTMFLVNISILGIKQQMGIKIVGARMCGRRKGC